MPKVSVIVPNYNHAHFLEQRIQSVLNQTYQDFELIYLDDASTDNSNEVFAKFSDNPRIRAIFNQKNSGSPFKQWNKGIQNANGEYIWIAESDDYADPIFLETLVSILDEYANIGVAYCQSYQVDENNYPLATMHWWTDNLNQERWRSDFFSSGLDECRRYLVFKNTIPNASAVLSRRSVLEQINLANNSLRLCGDWLTWVQLLLLSDLAFSAKILNYFRVHNTCVRYSTSAARYLYERMKLFAFINQQVTLPQSISEPIKDQLVREWMILTFAKQVTLDFDIYRAAKDCEPRVEVRLLKQMSASAMRKLKRQIHPSIPMGY